LGVVERQTIISKQHTTDRESQNNVNASVEIQASMEDLQSGISRGGQGLNGSVLGEHFSNYDIRSSIQKMKPVMKHQLLL
jgi:hypothetical protein